MGETIPELQVPTAAQLHNLGPLYDLCVLFTTPAHGFICTKVMYTLSRNSLLYKVIRCNALFA